VATQAESARVGAWWTFMGAHALLVERVGRDLIETAYNDRQGVTAAFNRNILVRIDRELGADFNVEQFGHRAFCKAAQGRIEMHLVSRRDQVVRVGGMPFFFAKGESIHTENSYKYIFLAPRPSPLNSHRKECCSCRTTTPS
jgi:uncharacterized SAM-dependent methyltransferase